MRGGRRRTRIAAAVIASWTALAVAACGDDGNQAASAEPPSPAATTQPADPPASTSSAEAPSEATGTGPAAAVTNEELEAVVRAWSAALNAGDNEAAADLFAPGAIIVQAGVAIQFEDRAAAIRWNADLPCSGTIVDLDIRNGVVLAVFELGDRATGPCDAAPGTLAAAAFLIENGKIAVWQQVAPPEDVSPERTALAGAGSAARA
jgi:hypothetical protein